MAADTAAHDIDVRSIVTLIIFFACNALVLFPLRIPLPYVVGSWAKRIRAVLLPPRDDADEFEPASKGAAAEDTPEGEYDRQGEDEGVVAGGPRHNGYSAETNKATQAGSTSPSASPSTSASSPTADSVPAAADSYRAARPVFTLGLVTAPVAGVLLLLASTCIPGSVVRGGIVGAGHVRPYDIMTLFLSFAYISLSLDCTGLLLYLAFTVAGRAPPNGRSLFAYLYALFVALALAVGNDPIVLSGTPFVAYFTAHARIAPPTAFLFAQFQAANLASALLVSSNPTNLVLTSSFSMSFLSFSAWTALPTLAAAVALFPVLLIQFRSAIPAAISPPHVVPAKALTDRWGALFTTTIFLVSIVLLVALSAAGKLEGVQGVWCVTAPAALLILARDCWYDYTRFRRRDGSTGAQAIMVDSAVEMAPLGPPRATAGDEEADGASPKDRVPDRSLKGSDSEGDTGRGDSTPEDLMPKVDPLPQSHVSVFDDEDGDESTRTTSIQPRVLEPQGAARRRINSTVVHSVTRARVMRRHGSGDSRTLNIPPPPPVTRDSAVAAAHVTLVLAPASNVATNTATQVDIVAAAGPQTYPPPSSRTHTPASRQSQSRHPLARLRRAFPTVATIVARLPLPLLPFAFSMFVLVEALDYTGWVSVWALWWERWARSSGAAGCIFLMGLVSVVGCNILGTNIGVTVLLSRILSVWEREIHPTKRALYGSVLALAIGSNFGAYSFSFPASLAGLLWRDILAQKGLHVRRLEFLRWNMLPLLATMVVGGCVVGAEVCVIFKHGES